MAAKGQESDRSLLADLADHAHKLMREFAELPNSQIDRASELLVELEHVIAEFKRLRPPPTFKGTRKLRFIQIEESRLCSACQRPVDLGKRNYIETGGAVYHGACYNSVARVD